MMAEKWGLTRAMLDQFSLDSHEKAGTAQDSGAFEDQIVGIRDPDGTVVLGTRESAAAPPWRRWANSNRRSKRTA